MAGETVITVVGNLTGDPEMRFTPSGAAVCAFRIASTPRIMDRQSSQWKDGEPLFLNCNVWRDMAENVAESLQRGMRVIVQGRLKQRSYDTREGEKRTVFELEVDEIGPALRYATAKVERKSGNGGSRNGNNGGGNRQAARANGNGNSAGNNGFGGNGFGDAGGDDEGDPFGVPVPAGAPAGRGNGGNFDEEPPF